MLTPQEVRSRAFQRASFGGYNMGQVDEFLDALTEDYTALYNDNAVLKSKMKVLVDKVEEYRSTEEAMRKTLMTAQRMADDIIREAEEKRAQILAEAEAGAERHALELRRQAEAEELRLNSAKERTDAFVHDVIGLCIKQVEFLAKLDQLAAEKPDEDSDSVGKAAEEIDDNVRRLLDKVMADALAGTAAGEKDAGDMGDTAEFQPVGQHSREGQSAPAGDAFQMGDFSARTTRIDFGDLQFGKDYEIL